MIAVIRKIVAPIERMVLNLVSRAIVTRVDDSTKMQSLQLEVLDGEEREDIERFQNYGFTSNPPEGSEAVVVFPSGRRDHGIVIAVEDRRVRLVLLEKGESAVYNDQGSVIVLKANGDIELTPASGTVSLTGDLSVSGTVTAQTDVVGGGKSLKNHTHAAGTLVAGSNPVTGVTGGPT